MTPEVFQQAFRAASPEIPPDLDIEVGVFRPLPPGKLAELPISAEDLCAASRVTSRVPDFLQRLRETDPKAAQVGSMWHTDYQGAAARLAPR